ncbi:MAG: Na(+)-translocating NADH-quinone reductase subunit C [Bdellovibrionales bacterium]|nr:Na(+)-translocating NADH-quinone reductase subunit C [Bdellovibrionales bacterium]
MHKDSVGKTIAVAIGLCLICSILVSTAAVKLRPLQAENKRLDIKKNLLIAADLLKGEKFTVDEIQKQYKKVQGSIVELSTGEIKDTFDFENFDARKAAKDSKLNYSIPAKNDLAKIKFRSKYKKVYQIFEEGALTQIVLPVHGKGLWSTLYGFIALSPDGKTIRGIGFYEHAETPGLGGEIDNPKWKALWKGKIAYDSNLEPAIKIIKGNVSSSTPDRQHKVDGLSGATITARGVQSLVNYWLGKDGFGPYLDKVRRGVTVL